MKQPVTIETKGGKLLCVEVPITAYDIKTAFMGTSKVYPILEWRDDTREVPGFYDSNKSCTVIFRGCEILGEISHANGEYVFSFDPEPFVEAGLFDDGTETNVITRYLDLTGKSQLFKTPHEAFISLLQSHGLTFVNEYGEVEPECDDEDQPFAYIDAIRHKRWREAEEKRVSGKLVVIKVNEWVAEQLK